MATSQKVKFERVLNANVRVSNSVDESRLYDITADVNVNGNGIDNFNSGTVNKLEGGTVATFNSYGKSSMTISYTETQDTNIQEEILRAVNLFIADVKQRGTSITINA